jgi:ribosomal protein S6
MKYELCYLVGESKSQDLEKIKEEVKNIVSKEGGKLIEPQIEEKRKMAYKVGKEIRGIYIIWRFEVSMEEELEGEEKKNVIENIQKKLVLFQDVLRFIIVKAEGLPELKQREERENLKREKRSPIYQKKEKTFERKDLIKEDIKKEEVILTSEKKQEGKEDVKSIDEKIEEILNI